ncbi:MAG: hypothetical protein WBD40_02005 [Tepidisphaeraceae bacterium]
MKIRRFAAAALVLAVVLMSAVRADAQVLQSVPSDALLVIKVRNLQDVSGKVAALAQQLGIAGLNPAMADPLAAVQQQSGIANGLDKNGDMVIYVPASLLDNPDVEQKPAVALWPVTDYKAFIGNFADAKEEGGITTFTMSQNPSPSYAANWGKYAAVSQTRELVAKKPATGLTVQGVAAKELDTKDLTVFFNMVSARPKLLAKIQEKRPEMLADMEKEIAASPNAKYGPLAKSAFNRAMDLAEQFVKETNAATYGVTLNNEGINTTTLADFDPKSQLGQRFAALKGTNESLLTGLPDGKYLTFGGAKVDSKVVGQLLSDLIGPVEGELANLGEDGKVIADYLAALKKSVAATEASRFGMAAPNGQLGQEAIIQVMNLAIGDGAALAAAQKEMFEAQEQLTGLMGGGKVTSKTTITPKAKTVAGVALDNFKSEINTADAQGPEAAQMQQMMAMMYGPGGLSGYTGVIDGKVVITAMGVNDELLEKAVTAAKAKEDALGKQTGVQAVRKQLPPNRLAEMFVPLDVVVSTGAAYAQQFGMPVQMQLPADLPPLGFTASTEGSAVKVDAHVPAQLVQSLVAAGMQVYMQMQGGAQPGGPGGL